MTFARSLLVASAVLAALPAYAQITAFKHIVVIVQENRTPDNLFNAMCQQHGGPAQCDPSNLQAYDIATDQWKNKGTPPVTPVPVDLAIGWDIEHRHDPDWLAMCDEQNKNGPCLMDGAASEICVPGKRLHALPPSCRNSRMCSATIMRGWTSSDLT